MTFDVGDKVERLSDVFGTVGKKGVRMMHGTVIKAYSDHSPMLGFYPELFDVQWDDGPIGHGYLPHGLDKVS